MSGVDSMLNKQENNDSGIEDKHTPKLWTRSFITLTLASFLVFLNLQLLLSSFSIYIKGNLDGNDMYVSISTSVFSATAIIARLLTPKWMKRWTRDTTLTIGLLVAAVTTALNALPDSIMPLIINRAVFGLGFGVASTIIPTLVAQIIPPSRMGEGIGYFGLSTSLAMSIGPAAGISLMKEAGFTSLSIIGAAVLICAIPLLYASGVYRMFSKQDKKRQTSIAKTRWDKVFVLPIYFPAILNVLVAITYSGILSFIGVYGEELGLGQVGLFFMFNAASILIVRPLSGKLFDRYGPMLVLIPSAMFMISSMVVLSYTTSMTHLIVSALLYGTGFGAIQPTLQAWMLRRSEKEEYGAVNGLFYNSTDVGVSIGAMLLGLIVTLTSYAEMYRYSAICMVLFIVCVFVYQAVAKKKQRQEI